MSQERSSATLNELHDRLGAMIDQIGQPDYSLRELVNGLCEVRDDLLRLVPSAVTRVPDPDNICDACAGTGTPASGGICMCGGSGKMSDAARYLREKLVASSTTESSWVAAEKAKADAYEAAATICEEMSYPPEGRDRWANKEEEWAAIKLEDAAKAIRERKAKVCQVTQAAIFTGQQISPSSASTESSHPYCSHCKGPAMSMGGCMYEQCPVKNHRSDSKGLDK